MTRAGVLAAALACLAAAACDGETPRILSVTILGDTRDTAGPYAVQAVIRGVEGDGTVRVVYSANGGTTLVPLEAETHGGRDDLFTAGIPGQPAGTMILYYVAVERGGRPVASHPPATGDAGADYYLSFRVLPPSGSCRADSDCLLGLEICADGTCRAFEGVCVETDGGYACPDGYVCDAAREPKVCVIAPQPCDADGDCPASQECDLGAGECVARTFCLGNEDCPPPQVCDLSVNLCAAP